MLLINRNIFIVEDNRLNRLIYQIALGKNGANLVFDPFGRDALSKLKQMTRIDLIILDLQLPYGISGFDIYEQIRALHDYDTTPIIAVTASEAANTLVKVRNLGFSGFIAQPIDQQLFPKQIRQIMAGEAIWAATLS